MIQKFLSIIFISLLPFAGLAFTKNSSDTDLFVLKNGYNFKADIIDTSGKYYVYKVYRGERLLRCVKKNEVSEIKFNYITPKPVVVAPVAETKPVQMPETKPVISPEVKPEPKVESKPEPVKPTPPVVEKKKYNPYTAPLKIRKGFEVIDTVRIYYDQDITHYKTDDNAVNAFSSTADLGPRFSQQEMDSASYQGLKANGKRNGSGILLFDNGSVYSGKIVNNIIQGYGYYSDAIIDYKGQFSNNTLSGLGICYYFGIEDLLKDLVFKGEFKDGKFWEGELYYTTSDNKRCVQQFKQGNPNAAKLYDE